MNWQQNYNPLGSAILSTLVAAIPVVVLLGCIASGKIKAHIAALVALAVAFALATVVVGMPAQNALAATALGAAYGALPISWIVLNTIFLYQLTKEHGSFDKMKESIAALSVDKRIQLVLIAFALGSFFEGTSGFGTPVAITGALLIGLGFTPLQASGLSLIANTAPVAFGAMGTPILALAGVTGYDPLILSKMVGRQLPLFSVIVPFWLIAAYDGRRGLKETWPTLLVAGFSFAIPQFLMSNFHGPTLVDVVAGATCILSVAIFVKLTHQGPRPEAQGPGPKAQGTSIGPWMPWIILCIIVFVCGLPDVKRWLNSIYAPQFPMPWLNGIIERMPPVVATPTAEAAVFSFNILSASGTAIFVSAITGGFLMGYKPAGLVRMYGKTLAITWRSMVTIIAMLALGYLTRYSGIDAILGLAFAGTGVLFPFFGTLLGWLGVALTGSDTASNVLFGSLQKITATTLGISPILMAAANSSGGVMGKMIDAQSIVVASTATRFYGQEGKILRFVFWHSVVLAILVGLVVLLQAYVPPFTLMVPPTPLTP
jgi:lactate permease